MKKSKSRYSSDLGSVYTASDRSSYKRPDEIVDLMALPDATYIRVRLIGGVMQTGGYWVNVLKKDKSIGRFKAPCVSWNPETNSQDPEVADPWRDFEAEMIEAGVDRQNRIMNFSKEYFMNAIIRKYQEEEPKNKPNPTEEEIETGCKSKDSDSWTPVRVISLPASLLDSIQKLKSINTHKVRMKDGSVQTKAFAPNHPKFGCDLLIMRDTSKKGAAQYSVQMSSHSPLTAEEQEYLTYDLDLLFQEVDAAQVQADFDGWAKRNKYLIDRCFGRVDAGEDDEDEKPARRKATRKHVEDDYDEDEIKPKKSKPAPVEDEVDDDGFDEEDEAPAPKKKPVKKAAHVEEDFDDEDFDDDEEEEEKPVRKPAAKKKAVEDDFDDDDEDFDDEPAPKKKPAAKKAPAKKQVEDDFDDEDFDDDEDF